MNLTQLDADLEGFADLGEIAINRCVGNLLLPSMLTESLTVGYGQFGCEHGAEKRSKPRCENPLVIPPGRFVGDVRQQIIE